MSDLETLQDQVAAPIAMTDGLLKEAHGDERTDLLFLRTLLGSAYDMVARLKGAHVGRAGRVALGLGARHQREIEGRKNVELEKD